MSFDQVMARIQEFFAQYGPVVGVLIVAGVLFFARLVLKSFGFFLKLILILAIIGLGIWAYMTYLA